MTVHDNKLHKCRFSCNHKGKDIKKQIRFKQDIGTCRNMTYPFNCNNCSCLSFLIIYVVLMPISCLGNLSAKLVTL